MLHFFAPRHIQEAHHVLKGSRKLLHYKRDQLSEATVADLEGLMGKLDAAIKARDRRTIEETTRQLDTQWSGHLPPASEAGWRENCEVFLVAIIIAIGVRTYFLQPFTIPTGSMQPTLNGIIGYPTQEPPPNPLRRVVDFVVFGRNYVNVVAKGNDQIIGLTEQKFLYFFTVTDIHGEHGTYRAWAPRNTLLRDFNVDLTREYSAGDVIARGYVDAGDHVFVDKVSYNFRRPHRGEVFVFKTTNIREIERQLRLSNVEGSQFYIKRLAALPGDELRIDPPKYYINGELARGFGFERVMSGTKDAPHDGYHGYGSGPPMGFLSEPDRPFRLPEHSYFALGDNSYNSSDSRYWGWVPEPNIMGRGLFVYWPFAPHWGFIK
ncbi:MAG: signal peptidase [Chthoniobacter sp.]|jgi:signal peptidase I|nr:signal peptidase [Chthoniobacter sp.]